MDSICPEHLISLLDQLKLVLCGLNIYSEAVCVCKPIMHTYWLTDKI